MTKKPDPLAPAHIEGQNPATPQRLPGHTGAVASAPAGGLDNEEELGGRPAFLFKSGPLAAVTLDSSGANLPLRAAEPWQLQQAVTLGVRDVGLPGINPEPVIRGIFSAGYYIWDTSDPSWGLGSSQ